MSHYDSAEWAVDKALLLTRKEDDFTSIASGLNIKSWHLFLRTVGSGKVLLEALEWKRAMSIISMYQLSWYMSIIENQLKVSGSVSEELLARQHKLIARLQTPFLAKNYKLAGDHVQYAAAWQEILLRIQFIRSIPLRPWQICNTVRVTEKENIIIQQNWTL